MGDPSTRQGSRTPHRGAVLPVDAYSLAVACGSRGVSLDIWPASHSAPAAPRVARLSGHDRDRSPSRTIRRATTWIPPRRSARQARSVRALAALLAVGGTPPSARYREFGVRCLCDASTAYAAASQRGTGAALGAAITRRALRPGNVACGDSDCGAPYHRVITRAPTFFLANPLPPLARRPLLAPVTTPFAPIRTPPPAGAVTGGRRVGPPPSPLWSKAARGASRRPRACAGGALSAPSAGGAAERQAGFGPDLAKPAAGTALGSVALATPVRAAGVDRAGRLRAARRPGQPHITTLPLSIG